MSTTSTTTYQLAQALGEPVEAPALISTRPFSARYDLDRDTGVISRLGHPLRGRSVAGMILICPGVQGGVAAGWTFMKLAAHDLGFAGLVFDRVNPVMVQGAQAASLAIAAGIDPRVFAAVANDTVIRLDPPHRRLVVLG